MAAKRKGTTGAVLDLLEVQTALEVCAQAGKHIAPIDAARLAEKIEASRDLLQQAILAATRILEDGHEA